jgi:hypothetical protein
MRVVSKFGEVALVAVFLLPAVILLAFAWSVWIANKRPMIQEWRLKAFRWGLLAASGSTAWFVVACLHLFSAGEPARGFWLFFNWVGILGWLFGFAASLAGKGSGRILLISSSIMLVLGVLGIASATTP